MDLIYYNDLNCVKLCVFVNNAYCDSYCLHYNALLCNDALIIFFMFFMTE